MYESYAAIYDLAQQGRYGERMADWTLEWLAEHGEKPRRVLDLACGTGAATLVFAHAGCEIVGVDQSQAMLDIAQAKARDRGLKVSFTQQDIRQLTANNGQLTTDNGQIDLVTCFADSLNYLTNDGDLECVFTGAAQLLRPGGWLVFDINTEAEYGTWDERDVVVCDTADLMLYQKLRFNRRTRLGSGEIGWMVREIDRWWHGQETHTQRAWSDADIRRALSDGGFEITVARLAPDAIDDRRFLYVCCK